MLKNAIVPIPLPLLETNGRADGNQKKPSLNLMWRNLSFDEPLSGDIRFMWTMNTWIDKNLNKIQYTYLLTYLALNLYDHVRRRNAQSHKNTTATHTYAYMKHVHMIKHTQHVFFEIHEKSFFLCFRFKNQSCEMSTCKVVSFMYSHATHKYEVEVPEPK